MMAAAPRVAHTGRAEANKTAISLAAQIRVPLLLLLLLLDLPRFRPWLLLINAPARLRLRQLPGL